MRIEYDPEVADADSVHALQAAADQSGASEWAHLLVVEEAMLGPETADVKAGEVTLRIYPDDPHALRVRAEALLRDAARALLRAGGEPVRVEAPGPAGHGGCSAGESCD
jgi:hypothetical protein